LEATIRSPLTALAMTVGPQNDDLYAGRRGSPSPTDLISSAIPRLVTSNLPLVQWLPVALADLSSESEPALHPWLTGPHFSSQYSSPKLAGPRDKLSDRRNRHVVTTPCHLARDTELVPWRPEAEAEAPSVSVSCLITLDALKLWQLSAG